MSIYDHFKELKLFYSQTHFEQFIADNQKENLSHRQVIEKLLGLECVEKNIKSTQRRLSASKIGQPKLMAHFNWGWPKMIDRQLIEQLLNCDFLESKKNIILAGPQGVGKTMIARNIGINAINKGHKVLFATAQSFVLDVASQESTVATIRRLKHYESPELLILDEIGYLNFDNKSADLLFELICRRHEKKSTIITTNLPFKHWGSIFPSAACVTALIDRITHKAEILKIEGDSFRTLETKQEKAKREKQNAKK